MPIYRLIKHRGLNTDLSPLLFAEGEADDATNIDFASRQGAFGKRGGTSLYADAGASVLNADVVRTDNGDYLLVKTAATGKTSLKYLDLASVGDGFTSVPDGASVFSGLNATSAGTFWSHNGCVYYFQDGDSGWWDGNKAGACYNVGLRAPTLSLTMAANGTGDMDGTSYYCFTVYDLARNCESNATNYLPTGGLDVWREDGNTAATIQDTGASAYATGDKVTSIRMWRTDSGQTLIVDDGVDRLVALPPAWCEDAKTWAAFVSVGFISGFNDLSLDRNEAAPVMDNNPPPLCNLAAIWNNRGWYLTTGNTLFWSHADRPEMVPYQNGWTTPWDLWRGLNHGRENRSTANALDATATAMAQGGGRLFVFTAGGTFVVTGGEGAGLQRVPTPHGCIGENAYARAPGGELFVIAKRAVMGWPGATDFSRDRFKTIFDGANATYLPSSIAGYDGVNETLMCAIPEGEATKPNAVYVLGLDDGSLSKWSFAWADGSTRGIKKILTVDLPTEASFVLFVCDDGKIYKYPDTNQDAGTNFGASLRMYCGQEWADREKDVVDVQVHSGSLTADVSVTVEGLDDANESIGTQSQTIGAAADNQLLALPSAQMGESGRLVRLTFASSAGDDTWRIEAVYVQTEHRDQT